MTPHLPVRPLRPLRMLAAFVVRGPHAPLIKADLEEMYARDRADGVSWWRAHCRYTRRLTGSAISVGHAAMRSARAPDAEWRSVLRGDSMLQDLRFAFRLFRRHPAPAGIAIAGLALAIGVVSAVFSVVNASLLRPFGMDDPSSIVSVSQQGRPAWLGWPYTQFLRMREGSTLGRLEASRSERVRFSVAAGDEAGVQRLVQFVSGDYLDMLGGRPALGRSLAPFDDAPGAPPVMVVSHHFWKNVLSADPATVGRTLWMNGAPITLVGVLQPRFTGPEQTPPSIWAPLAALDDVRAGKAIEPTSVASVVVIARLAPGAASDAAQESLSAIVLSAAPASAAGTSRAPRRVQLESAASPMAGAGDSETYIALACVFTLAGLVLALACANTANLLMAAAATRTREVAVRRAMGATRGRLIRQMVSESLLLGVMAGGFGLVFAVWLVPIFGELAALPPEVDLAPDARVFVFTATVALICGLGAGLSPARHGARGHVLAALQSSGSGRGGNQLPSRLRTSFVGFQAAVSMLLLVSAMLLARTAMVMTRADMGFDPDRLLAVSLEPLRPGVDLPSYTRAVVAAVRAVPAVEQVSVTEYQPFGPSTGRYRLTHEGAPYGLTVNRSDEAYFATAGVRILRGRAFTAEEVAREAPVALISESVTRAFFGGRDPIGQSLSLVPGIPDALHEHATVIGVVADAMLHRPEGVREGAVFRPLAKDDSKRGTFSDQGLRYPPNLIVRMANPVVSAPAIEDAVRRLDARVRPATWIVGDRVASYLQWKRTLVWMVAPAAILAFALAVLGVYGVTAFVVSQRTQEVSIRMAIGASSSDVSRLLVRDSLRPVIIGLGVGLLSALLASRASARMMNLTGISPHDPISIAIAAAILTTGALFAVIVPARRAARTDPAGLLRQV